MGPTECCLVLLQLHAPGMAPRGLGDHPWQQPRGYGPGGSETPQGHGSVQKDMARPPMASSAHILTLGLAGPFIIREAKRKLDPAKSPPQGVAWTRWRKTAVSFLESKINCFNSRAILLFCPAGSWAPRSPTPYLVLIWTHSQDHGGPVSHRTLGQPVQWVTDLAQT